jgi:hypothetical protein
VKTYKITVMHTYDDDDDDDEDDIGRGRTNTRQHEKNTSRL